MNEKRLSRRDFLRMSALTAAGAALAGCARATPTVTKEPTKPPPEPTATTAPAPPEPVTITYWTFWGGFEDMLDEWKATEAYKKAFDDNNLVLDMRSDVPRETILANIAAGTPPDVGCTADYLDYMSRGVAIPIEDLVATSSLKPTDFVEANWKACSFKGTQYGVPVNECFVRRGLNYNVRMVEEAGLDPDDPPVTWAECLEWHKALTKFDQAGNLLQIGLDPYDAMGGSWWFDCGCCPADSWGLDWFDDETRQFNLDNEKMADSFETLGEFVRIIGPDNLAGFRGVEGQGGWGGSYNAEVQAMIIEGYWHPGETAIQMPEVAEVNRATWVPVPEARRGVKFQFGGGHMLLWFKDAPNPQAAFPVAEFLNMKEICDIIFAANGWLPALKSYLETVDPSSYPGLDFYLNSVKEANEWWAGKDCEIHAFAGDQFPVLREQVFRGEITGAEAAAKFQELCDEEYKAAGYA